MPERLLVGTPASPGVALGVAWRPDDVVSVPGRAGSAQRERERARAALAAAADALRDLAARLEPEEAAIVEAGVLMAGDPALLEAVDQAIESRGLAATEAILDATGMYADAIAAIDDEMLAARADDVRSLGRRAARLADGAAAAPPPGSDSIVIARELGPADVAELAPALVGVALAGSAATAHAAIVARSLGVPMITGVDAAALDIRAGTRLALDGSSGTLTVEPSPTRASAAGEAMRSRQRAARRAQALRDEPAVTRDGARVGVMVNVASRQELDLGLRSGAEGIGLLRTELAFLDAAAWPHERDHARGLEPILAGLDGRPAIVRVLDFGADKSPPFLRGVPQRGLELLLDHPSAFGDQLRAMLALARRHDVRILLPMVNGVGQVREARALLAALAEDLALERIPPLGSMIETPAAVDDAAAIAGESDFLSIGTNDLTASTLRADRFTANAARVTDPLVLRSIARSVEAARDRGIPIEVCGEAGSDPIVLPLLIGLGVDDVSVGAARVGEVRGWIRGLSMVQAADLARAALTMDAAEDVEWAAREATRAGQRPSRQASRAR
jgi:phosphoenolpyruvate-protein kinase (PTS system EI component)